MKTNHSSLKKKILGSLAILALLCFSVLTILLIAYPASRAADLILNRWTKTRDAVMSTIKASGDPIQFSSSKIDVPGLSRPTSLQFGPDGMLYVASQNGVIFRLMMVRDGKGGFRIGQMDSITLVADIPNHNDNGSLNPRVPGRQVTGLLVTGTSEHPILYVSSSDPRMTGDWDNSGKAEDGDLNLDTNSGIISELVWDGERWVKTDLVRGLPRSEENHSLNGIALDPTGNTLYVACGGNTNAGGPSKYFGYLSEYALSASLLRINLEALRKMPVVEGVDGRHVYDLPTLNDPSRQDTTAGVDVGDPFGGGDGLNQARWVENGPVGFAAVGFRNPYDILLPTHHTGRMLTIDNGADEGIGGFPMHMGTASVSNEYDQQEIGSKKGGLLDRYVLNRNSLHSISTNATSPLYYGGHPVPVRANPLGAGWYWRDAVEHFSPKPTKDWPPVPAERADPRQGEFRVIGMRNTGMATYDYSTNGLAEYTSDAFFGGSMKGDILAASFDGSIIRTKLNDAGDRVVFSQTVAHGFGIIPIDLVCQGDLDPFPGTVWVADYGANCIHVLTPTHAAKGWAAEPAPDGSAPQARHESSFVEAGGKFHLIGGRGVKSMDVFDPFTRHWSRTSFLPDSLELNHAQAVSLGGRIYLGCGLTGPFPNEKPVADLYMYDPSTQNWSVQKNLVPEGRRRGSSGAVTHDGKLYFIGGTTHGHASGSVPWTDVYDPATGEWNTLPDAPHARDHFQAAVVEGKIYAIGGRRSNQAKGRTFEDVEPSVDVYDIARNQWSTLPASANIPTPRGGAATAVVGQRIVVIGGESTQPKAHDQAEAFDTRTGKWTSLPKLKTGRHGTQAIVRGHSIIITAGCGLQGGTPELSDMETLILPEQD